MNLSQILAGSAFTDGFYGAQDRVRQQGMDELRQVGSLVSLQSLLQDQARKQQVAQRGAQYRAAIGAATTPEEAISVATKFAGPDDVLKIHQGSLDRKAQTEANMQRSAEALQARQDMFNAQLENRRMQEQWMHQFRLSQLKNDQDRAAETTRHNRMMEEIASRSNAESASLRRMQLGIQQQLAAMGGKPPHGYRWKPDGDLEAIPGGPADLKLQGVLNQDTATLNTTTANFDRLATAANEVLNHPGLGGITGLRGALPNVPGSAAANAQAKLDTLRAQVGFGVLQELRNASKTGGGLGQVTEREHALLQNALAALHNAQGADQMRESLQKVIDYAGAAKERLRGAFNLKHGAKATSEDNGLKAKVEGFGMPYEPDKYEYREVNGQIQRRKK
jgi:hypothetical protein